MCPVVLIAPVENPDENEAEIGIFPAALIFPQSATSSAVLVGTFSPSSLNLVRLYMIPPGAKPAGNAYSFRFESRYLRMNLGVRFHHGLPLKSSSLPCEPSA